MSILPEAIQSSLNAEEEKDLLSKLGKKKCKDRLILSCSAFVLQQATTMSYSSPADKEDLFQEGMLGLNEAYKTFDPKKGIRFITYGSHYSSRRMKTYIKKLSLTRATSSFYRDKEYVNNNGMPEIGDIVLGYKWSLKRQKAIIDSQREVIDIDISSGISSELLVHALYLKTFYDDVIKSALKTINKDHIKSFRMYIEEGLEKKEIAKARKITTQAAGKHIKNVMKKLMPKLEKEFSFGFNPEDQLRALHEFVYSK